MQEQSEEQRHQNGALWRRVLSFVCGIEGLEKGSAEERNIGNTAESPAQIAALLKLIRETRVEKIVTLVNLAVLICITFALWIVFR